MLRGIRNASTTWLGRIVMGAVMTLLAGIFALWGINDIFNGFGHSYLASIGKTEISVDQFRQNYNDRLQAMSQQLGKVITPEQASAFGLQQQVLSEMVAQAGLDQRAKQMGLGLSNAEISRRITGNPQFQTPDGKFDAARFQDALLNANLTEQRFVADQRANTLRRQIIDSVSGNVTAPKTWLDAINQFQNEQRSIAYVALGPAQAGDIAPPTDDQLSKYFEQRQIMFRAPEFRKIVTVTVTPAELAKTLEISEDDLKKIFDDNRGRYITPEKRHVEQMVFPTMADAQAASDKIKSGTTFAALAAERGLKEQDLDLGTVTKTTIIDPAVADAAFSLKEGEVSAPVQGRFGAVIVTVSQIIPEEKKTFADVEPQIRNDVATVRARNMVQDLHDKIEDDRAGGTSLEDAAKKLNLPVATYEAVDRSNHDPQGNAAISEFNAGQIINAAFATDVGVDNDPLEADGGFIWYDVAGITPARDRNLDEVKSEVEQRWRDDEIADRLKTKAGDILDKLKSGTPLETLASANGVTVQTATDLKRGQPAPGISARMIEAIFHTAKDGVNSAEGDTPTQWIVFRITDDKVPPPDPNSASAKQMDQKLQRDIGDDLFGQYMASVEDELGTNVNQAALAQAFGNGTPETN
jgi:peptidyl-prolyl cis-trans isomerase D